MPPVPMTFSIRPAADDLWIDQDETPENPNPQSVRVAWHLLINGNVVASGTDLAGQRAMVGLLRMAQLALAELGAERVQWVLASAEADDGPAAPTG